MLCLCLCTQRTCARAERRERFPVPRRWNNAARRRSRKNDLCPGIESTSQAHTGLVVLALCSFLAFLAGLFTNGLQEFVAPCISAVRIPHSAGRHSVFLLECFDG